MLQNVSPANFIIFLMDHASIREDLKVYLKVSAVTHWLLLGQKETENQ